MQSDFVEAGGYFARQGLDIAPMQVAVAATRALIEALPATLQVIHTRHVYAADGADDIARAHRIRPARLSRAAAEPPVKRGSPGAQIVAALTPRAADRVVDKNRFDAFHGTDLDRQLRQLGITTLIFAGVVADVCVETTLRSAYVRDFDVVLAQDCVGAWREEDRQRTIAAVNSHFGVSFSNRQILAAFAGGEG